MVALNPDLQISLEREALQRGTTADHLLAQLVQEWLEDAEDVRVAEECLSAIREGKMSVSSLDEVRRELGC